MSVAPRLVHPTSEPAADLRWLTRSRKKERRVVSFGALLEEWLATRGDCPDSRSAAWRHFRPCFGALRDVRELQAEHVVGWLEVLADDEKLAPKTRAKLLSFLATILELALETGAVEANVVRLIPRKARPGGEALDPDRPELEVLSRRRVTLMCRHRSIPYWTSQLFEVALLTGMRLGEASGVSWADVVEEEVEVDGGRVELRRYLYVRRQWSSKRRRLKAPKTKRPKRVPVSPTLWARLQQSRRRFAVDFGREPGAEDPIAPYAATSIELGTRRRRVSPARWNGQTALRAWHHHLLALGIPHPPTGARRFHATRHTFISLLIVAGAPAPAVREITHRGRASRDAFWLYVHANFAAVYAAAQLFTHDPDVLADCERGQAELF